MNVYVREVLPKLSSLSSRFQLVLLAGHQEHAGHKLISAAAAEDLATELVGAVRASKPDVLAKEWNLLHLLYWVQQKLPEGTSALPAKDNLGLNATVLIEAKAEVLSQTLGSSTVRRLPRLQWDALVDLYGGEDAVRVVVDALEASAPGNQRLIESIALAKRYLSGWRPRDFGDDD